MRRRLLTFTPDVLFNSTKTYDRDIFFRRTAPFLTSALQQPNFRCYASNTASRIFELAKVPALDFKLARNDHEDDILREIGLNALTYLFDHVNSKEIKCLLLTGSLANGEGTVIKYGSSLIASDFDFVVYLNPFYYLKNKRNFGALSQQVSTLLKQKGFGTHVVFLPATIPFNRNLGFAVSNIYEYENAVASRCLLGKKPLFNESVKPTKKDALELTFTVVGELLFADVPKLSQVEQTYVYAKRSLTLLNSLLISRGFFSATYQERIEIAKEHAGDICLGSNEMKVLQFFTEYKLSGSLSQLLSSLGYTDLNDLIQFQKNFLFMILLRTLYFELACHNEAKGARKRIISTQEMTNQLPKLLGEYYSSSETSLLSRTYGTMFYVIWSLTGNTDRKNLFATFLFHKKPPKLILNILITLILIGNGEIVSSFLKEVFPWLAFSSEINIIEKMAHLWQIAQESVKL